MPAAAAHTRLQLSLGRPIDRRVDREQLGRCKGQGRGAWERVRESASSTDTQLFRRRVPFAPGRTEKARAGLPSWAPSEEVYAVADVIFAENAPPELRQPSRAQRSVSAPLPTEAADSPRAAIAVQSRSHSAPLPALGRAGGTPGGFECGWQGRLSKVLATSAERTRIGRTGSVFGTPYWNIAQYSILSTQY